MARLLQRIGRGQVMAKREYHGQILGKGVTIKQSIKSATENAVSMLQTGGFTPVTQNVRLKYIPGSTFSEGRNMWRMFDFIMVIE